MRFHSSCLLVATFALIVSAGAGCSVVGEDVGESSAELSNVLHVPEGAERKANFLGMRAQLSIDLHGQEMFFNATDPVGRFYAHGDWAFFQGIIEGADGNRTPIDYANSTYADDVA